MDNRVDVGESDIENCVALRRSVAVRYSVQAGKILGGFFELIPILHGKGSAAKRNGTVGSSHLGIHDLAEHLDTGSVRSG